MSSPLSVLKNTFGYDKFRGDQQAIVESIIAGDDALVIMPTGGGKSLCYQIPSIVRSGCGVVVSPLIALMQDQVSTLMELGISCGFLNSSQSFEESQWVEQQLRQGQLDLLYIAPERLLQSRTLDLLKNIPLALFAIDEAHCVSQWGHDFRADYLQLSLLVDYFPTVPRIALTATADERTREEIVHRLSLTTAKQFIAGFDRPNIRYRIALKDQPKQQLLRFLKNEHPQSSGIVYCLSRKKTETIAEWLTQQGFTALPYHAGLSSEARLHHQQRFLREEKIIVVATIAFGMGIDKPDVRFVAHLDLPKSIEAYYQESGRAGRDGEPADAWMVYGLEDVIKLREMLAQTEITQHNADYKRIERQKLEAMLGLCEITSCRRQALLQYFDDQLDNPCGNCDTCLQSPDSWDATVAAQKAISCAYRAGQRFGVNHLIDILRGAETEKIQQFNHHQLSVYGVGKELDKQQWRSVYRQLIARGFLQIDTQRFNAVVLSEACRPLLQGKINLALRKDVLEKAPLRQKTRYKTQQRGALWDALRHCRGQLAKEHNVPPYVIFHDSTLVEMMELQPENEQQFSCLTGVGETKQQRYAASFLSVIKSHRQQSSSLSETVLATLLLFQQGMTVEQIAEERQLALNTVYQHASQLIYFDELTLDTVFTINRGTQNIIEGALVDCEFTEPTDKLKPVYEALAEEYSYELLRCVAMNYLRELNRAAA